MLEIARELEDLEASAEGPNASLHHTCFTHEGGAGGKQKVRARARVRGRGRVSVS